MILSGHEIKQQVAAKNIVIAPFGAKFVGPNSYDLHLADDLLIYDEMILDPEQENRTLRLKIPPEGLVLRPGRVYLASTQEYTETHKHVPRLVGRSSIGRLGLFVHVTAGFGDVGFSGRWTLELVPTQPIRVRAGMRICQIYYSEISGEILTPYAGKYQHSQDVVESRSFLDREVDHGTEK